MKCLRLTRPVRNNTNHNNKRSDYSLSKNIGCVKYDFHLFIRSSSNKMINTNWILWKHWMTDINFDVASVYHYQQQWWGNENIWEFVFAAKCPSLLTMSLRIIGKMSLNSMASQWNIVNELWMNTTRKNIPLNSILV